MRTELIMPAVLMVSVLSGCKSTTEMSGQAEAEGSSGNRVLLTVDFQQGQTLQYRFVSAREIILDWDPNKDSDSGRSSVNNYLESVEMVVAYTPIEIDQYGLTKIKATCASVRASRGKGADARGVAGSDAVESFGGKSFVFSVAPSGRIQDYLELDALIRQVGEKAFRPDTSRGRVKEPDMIWDFIACQWFLWDSISSVPKPSAGVAVGQSWTSQLCVPMPMVLRKVREVTYRLNEIRTGDSGNIAVIAASYKLGQSSPRNWPVPYSGKFQMSGTFGFLGPFEFLDLQGQGEELFNIDAGRLERYSQQYTVQMKASLPPLGIRANPHITISQKLTMERLE